MSQTMRHPEILERARRDGKVTVDALAAHFGVTLQTIRRDLTELAEAGRLERVHGGAVLPSGAVNLGYAERRALNHDAKAAIARACAAAIPDKASVALNIGTSTEAVARELLHHRGLLVVTNNMNVASILAANTDCEIVLTGGRLRATDGGLLGSGAIEAFDRFKPDIAVMGCSAVDSDGDLLDYDVDEVGVSQTLLRQARRAFLVADQSKFDRRAPVRIASLSAFDTVYTDAPLPPALARALEGGDTETVVCRG